jgi:hypothetical protein
MNGLIVVLEKLMLDFEISEHQCHMHGDRRGAKINYPPFCFAQIEVCKPVFIGKARQTVQIVDFVQGEDRQAMGIVGNVRCQNFPPLRNEPTTINSDPSR